MSSRSLVICDQEEKYASALAAYLTKKRNSRWYRCATIRDSVRIQQEEAIDILLISSGYTQEIRKEIQGQRIRPDRDGKREYWA